MKDGDRDVIYALRTAHQNQTQHIILADNKANVLIGIVAVVLTIMSTRLSMFSTLDRTFSLIIATFIVLQVIALLLALLVITPKTLKGFDAADKEEMTNPFFFGFFTRLSQQDYLHWMQTTLENNRQARDLLARDMYQIGCVLQRKYRLLKLAYLFTVLGFVSLFLPMAFYIASGRF